MSGVLALLVLAPAAHAASPSVAPVEVNGNPRCADFGLTSITKFDPVASGTKSGITLTKHDTYYVKWTSTVAVDWVIVKGGPNSNIYTYATDTFGDDWLSAPLNGANPYGLSHVEFCTDGQVVLAPGISIAKSGPDSAYVGDRATFTYLVTNTGGVKLTDVTVTDDKCAPVTRVPNGDVDFDPGDVWTYTCTTTITGAMGDQLVNVARACGKFGNTEKCDTDTHTTKIPVPSPLTPLAVTPAGGQPGGQPGGLPGVQPAGGVLPETLVSGTARLRGPSGCVKQAFRARVSGRSIASVAFYVDGKLVKRFNGQRSVYSIKVKPRLYGVGRHRIVARVRFVSESGTQARRLPLTFRRCAQGEVAPRFTG